MQTKSKVNLMIVFALLSAIDFAVILHYMNMSSDTQLETRQVCVSCSHHNAGLDSATLVQGFSKKMKDGFEKCCAVNYDQMSAIMEFIRQKQAFRTESLIQELRDVAPSHVSAHKRLLPNNLLDSSESSNTTVIHLRLDDFVIDPLREHAKNVEVLPSGYLILVPGVYHIYSNIEFTSRDNRLCKEYNVKTMRQGVVRSRANQRQDSGVLLSSAHTCCDSCSWNKETSYIGGTFHLQAGDHLHVEVSGLRLVNFHKESSFFGLMMLANGNIQHNT